MTEWQNGIRAFQEGRLREAVDRLRAATVDYERTASQDSRRQAYAYLGAALYALGNAAGAVEAFLAALLLTRDAIPPLDLLLNLTNSLLATGRRAEAQARLQQTLEAYPGALEARMLLERLQSRGETEPLTGAVLGETPEGVKRYLETLSFGSVRNGYAPDQVRAALTHIKHYINALSDQLASRDEAVAQYAVEIERLRQSEEALVENLMQARAEADQWQQRAENQAGDMLEAQKRPASGPPLTPLEKLLQKKS